MDHLRPFQNEDNQMQKRYFREPYQFVPPFRSDFWCKIVTPLMPRQMKRVYRVEKWELRGQEKIKASLARGAGILLTPNHSRYADTPVMALLSIQLKQYFFYVASYHLFKQSRFKGWMLNRIGAFSILREGSDREAIRESARILSNAERPLVIYPEGTWFRQNDRLGPLQEGTALIVRQAAKKADRPIVVHPVSIKYWYLKDPRPQIAKRLSGIERYLHWDTQDELEVLDRINKLSSALLAIKEVEYLGNPQTGSLSERLANLIESQIRPMEREYLPNRASDQLALVRIRALRQVLVRKLWQSDAGSPKEQRRWQDQLSRLLMCELLASHSQTYLHERPSYERLGEAIERIEESITDRDEPVAPLGAVLQVGDPLDVNDFLNQRSTDRQAGDPLMQAIATQVQQQVDALLAEGPPAEWKCPAPLPLPEPQAEVEQPSYHPVGEG